MINQKSLDSIPAILPSAGRREPERSEGDRRHADGKIAALPSPLPNPEVVAQAQRRRFTAEYKLRILTEADQAKGAGGVGALLRREGLYSSLLTDWRRERNSANLQALAPQKRGPKSQHSPLAAELEQLRRENQRLAEELRKAEIVIDIQKKVAALLGQITPSPSPEGRR